MRAVTCPLHFCFLAKARPMHTLTKKLTCIRKQCPSQMSHKKYAKDTDEETIWLRQKELIEINTAKKVQKPKITKTKIKKTHKQRTKAFSGKFWSKALEYRISGGHAEHCCVWCCFVFFLVFVTLVLVVLVASIGISFCHTSGESDEVRPSTIVCVSLRIKFDNLRKLPTSNLRGLAIYVVARSRCFHRWAQTPKNKEQLLVGLTFRDSHTRGWPKS